MLIGACFDGSGINASDTLKNENFKPHAALKSLLEWLASNGADPADAQRGLAGAINLQRLGSEQGDAAQQALAVPWRSDAHEATAGHGLAAPRRQLDMG